MWVVVGISKFWNEVIVNVTVLIDAHAQIGISIDI